MKETISHESACGSLIYAPFQKEDRECWMSLTNEEFQNAWFIHSLYVHRHHRGMGIGRNLMSQVIEKANAEKRILCLSCFAFSDIQLESLRSFYHSLGFKQSGKCEDDMAKYPD